MLIIKLCFKFAYDCAPSISLLHLVVHLVPQVLSQIFLLNLIPLSQLLGTYELLAPKKFLGRGF